MQAVVLCGGRGERLMPLTACRPAGLLRITGNTVLNYTLNQLKKAGFNKVTFALGYLEGMIMSEYESGEYEGIQINFISTEELGTSGALAQAFTDDDMLVIEANCIFNFDLKRIQSFHTINKAVCTVVTKQLPDLSEYTCFSCDSSGIITSMSQNPSKDNLNAVNAFAGVYVLSKDAFNLYQFSNGNDFLRNVVPDMIGNDKLMLYSEKGYFSKITNASGFIKAQRDMLTENTGIKVDSKYNENKIYSDTPGNFNGVAIIPPVYIGSNVTIDKGTVIEPCSVIDDNAVIGARVRVSGSYVGENAVVSSRCELTESVVCSNALIKKSVHCGEYSVIGEKAVIGESSRIEDNIKIWAGKEVIPNSIISRHIIIGSGKSMHIDDESEFNFGNSLNAPTDFAKMGMAIGTAFNKNDVILIGYSDEETSKILSDSLISGLVSTGIKVFNAGICTNQHIMYGTSHFCASAGCFVSADYEEKIKITDKGGLPLKRNIEIKIENSYNNNSFRTLDCHTFGKIYEFNGTKALYEIFLETMLPESFVGLNAEIRTSSKETACLADDLFHSKNDIDGEKIIFHVSADGNSCSAYTEKTGYIFHEKLILLAMKALFNKKIPVSLPFSFPMKAESVAETENGRILRYYNSSDNNTDEEARAIAQRRDNLFVRDGLALACIICGYLSENNLTFLKAISEIPKFSSIQRYVSYNGNIINMINELSVEKAGEEGVFYSKDNTRALIRPLKSGNGLMIFAESFKSEEASAACDEIQEKLKKYEANSK